MIAPTPDDGDDGEAPEHQEHVHEDVVDAPGDPLAGRGRETDEDEPGVVDRGVREHPLHVALHETEDRPEQQREHRDRPQERLPVRAERPEGGEEHPQQRRETAGLGEAAMNPVAGVGAPW